jgi:ribonuclease BN (tRNA processing enzyme)
MILRRSDVRVTLVPSSIASDRAEEPGQYLISYLINDTLCIDAGSIGLYGTPQQQARVLHILISHSHIDHTASLPIFLENAFEAKAECVTIHGSDYVLEALQQDLFNDRTWPDFVALSTGATPLVKLERIEPYRPLMLEGLRIMPVPVDHVVPTLGFVISDTSSTVVIASDTGPTEDLWRIANAVPNLAAIYLEASFPDAMSELAAKAKHLTPALFGQEVRKLSRPVPVVAVHLKARFRAEIAAELAALGLPNVEIGRYGTPYDW